MAWPPKRSAPLSRMASLPAGRCATLPPTRSPLILDTYLSDTHVEDVRAGCAMAACLSEVRRQDPAIGAAFTAGFFGYRRVVTGGAARGGRAGREKARARRPIRPGSAASPWRVRSPPPTRPCRGRSWPPPAWSWPAWRRSKTRGRGDKLARRSPRGAASPCVGHRCRWTCRRAGRR